MADLTPQLRTRLSRVERVVGIFVLLATILLLAGLGYYIWHTAMRKGWLLLKVPYNTSINSAAGIAVGDAVKMMGFDVGQITVITANEPGSTENVYVQFLVHAPYYGYIWTDSYVKLSAGDVFGKRYLELIEGGTTSETNKNIYATYKTTQKKVWGFKREDLNLIWDPWASMHVPWKLESHSKGYRLEAQEAPALASQLESISQQVAAALPGIFALTNQISAVLSNTTQVTATADDLMTSLRPTINNLQIIAGNLTNPVGSLGEWMLPKDLNANLNKTLESANETMDGVDATLLNVNTNLTSMAGNINLTLINLANITSNLNAQVQANSNILSGISSTVTNADVMLQGLRRHWFLKGAFKEINKAEDEIQEQRERPQSSPLRRRTPRPRAGKQH